MDSRVRRSASTTRGPAEGIAALDEVFAAGVERTDPDGRFPTGPSRPRAGTVASERGQPGSSSGTGRTDGADVLQVCRVREGGRRG